MSNPNSEEVAASNQRSLNTLLRAIQFSQGQFSLILARCNYTSLRDRVVQQLLDACSVPIHSIAIPDTSQTLFSVLQAELRERGQEKAEGREEIAALMVFGLESVQAIDQVLISANQVREEFRKQFQFPLVLWLNDRVLLKILRLAPDFKAWAAPPIQFEIVIADLVHSLEDHANRLFASVLDAGDQRFAPSWAIVPTTNSLRQAEFEFALHDIHNSGYPLDLELQANLDFLLGQDAHAQGELETARECYERSLAFWQAEAEHQQAVQRNFPSSPIPHPSAVEKEACILIHLGLWWRSYAVLQRSAYTSACELARDFFCCSLKLFEEANRQDLVAKFIIPLAEVLQKLEQWDALERVAKNALVLHTLYGDAVRQARDHGFLAEAALARKDWTEAKQQSESALRLLEALEQAVAQTEHHPLHPHVENSLELAWRYHQGWYLFLLARAEDNLGNTEQAIAQLEQSRSHSYPQDEPLLYIQILNALWALYFQQGRYLDAFRTKLTRRSLEQQYGFRAFVGALRLEPHRYLLNPVLAQEISASGRQQDVKRLVERLSRDDYKLTVIHGRSGVGKSSIVNAGLFPTLKDRVIGDRIALPVVLNVYTDWLTTLSKNLTQSLSIQPFSLLPPPSLLTLLQHATDNNFLPVLIFDQFEEFFFVCDTPLQRRPLYEFLRDSLNLPFVKVILTIREDYLHYLLEFQRLTQLDIINNDILGKEIRYPLSDFSPDDAKSVIKSLTNQARFYLDDDLVDELVRDLAGEIGEVRPIELQVVGAELQAEGITTLAQYREKGPKETLVARSLELVVKDCGPENEAIARIVLFLLTNDKGTRPTKTLDDLEADLVDLGLTGDIKKLDLVLEVLLGSGLLLLIPEMPDQRYQLIHDYLVDFIRDETFHQQLSSIRHLANKQDGHASTDLIPNRSEGFAANRSHLPETSEHLQAVAARLSEENQSLARLNRLLIIGLTVLTGSAFLMFW